MMKLFKDILTGIDNETYDNGRVLCIISFTVYFALAIWSFLVHHGWAPMDFSGGATAMAVGFGVNIKLKSDTEPKK